MNGDSDKMCIGWLSDGMKAEQTCKEIIAEVVKEGYKYQISHRDLVKIIMNKRDIKDERAVQGWINALQIRDFIILESTRIHKIYQLNPSKVPDLFQVLKDKPQTKLS
jgi:hypothetical protein